MVGTQREGPGAAQIELATEEMLLVPFCTGSLSLDFSFILPDCLAALNLICDHCAPWAYFGIAAFWSRLPRRQLYVCILIPQVYSLPCLFQMLAKLLFPAYIPQVSKVVCISFLLLELLTILSQLEPLVSSKNMQPLPFFHPGHE